MSRSKIVAALIFWMLGLVGCGNETVGGSGGGSATGGNAGEGGAGGGGAPPDPFDSVFHHRGWVDTANLAFLDEGLFVWSVYGCDFCWVDGGDWVRTGDTLELTPGFGRATMPWPRPDFEDGAVSATVKPGPGSNEITVTVIDSTEAMIEQIWSAGRMCAVCDGGRGPSGSEPCDVPMSTEEADACAHL